MKGGFGKAVVDSIIKHIREEMFCTDDSEFWQQFDLAIKGGIENGAYSLAIDYEDGMCIEWSSEGGSYHRIGFLDAFKHSLLGEEFDTNTKREIISTLTEALRIAEDIHTTESTNS